VKRLLGIAPSQPVLVGLEWDAGAGGPISKDERSGTLGSPKFSLSYGFSCGAKESNSVVSPAASLRPSADRCARTCGWVVARLKPGPSGSWWAGAVALCAMSHTQK